MIGEFFKTYPYLFTNLITTTFLLAAGWFALTRTHWKVMMISGLASSPAFLFLVFLENEYWNPVRVGGLVLGFEDFLCSFACGAMVWFVIGLFFGDRISFNLQGKKILKRYLALASLSVTFFLLLCLIKVPGMTSLILTCLIVGAILLLRQRSLWLPILTGFLVFPLFYLGVVKIYFLPLTRLK